MSKKRSLGKGFAAGALGGALGTLALNLVQQLSVKGTQAAERAAGNGEKYTQQQKGLMVQFNEAHALTADAVAGAAGQHLSRTQRMDAVPLVEYAFGMVCAGIYGALAEDAPAVTAGFGTLFGAVLFTGASEIVLPSIKFVPPPSERTPVQHLGGLMGNVIYGAVTEATRRAVRG